MRRLVFGEHPNGWTLGFRNLPEQKATRRDSVEPWDGGSKFLLKPEDEGITERIHTFLLCLPSESL